MEGPHKTITKLSKLNIVVGVVSFITMLIYIILASTIRMAETNIIITYFFTVVIPTVVYLIIDVIIGIYALVNQKKFYRSYIPYGIAVSCLLAFFSYPYIGIIGMIANISLCKVDIRESEWCDEGRSLINDTTTTTAFITTTTDSDIPSPNSVSMHSLPTSNVSSSAAAQNPYVQPIYYGAPAQYPTYAQQKPSAEPLQQQHTTIDILPPSQPAQPYETPAVAPIYPNISSLPGDSAPTAPPAMSVNAESYGYTYGYDPK